MRRKSPVRNHFWPAPSERKQHRGGLPSLAVEAVTADRLGEDGRGAGPRWLRLSFRSEFSLLGPLDCRNKGRPQLWQRARGKSKPAIISLTASMVSRISRKRTRCGRLITQMIRIASASICGLGKGCSPSRVVRSARRPKICDNRSRKRISSTKLKRSGS
jgi:hypothetical protein